MTPIQRMPRTAAGLAQRSVRDRSMKLMRLKEDIHQKLLREMDIGVLNLISPDALTAQIREAAEELCRSHVELIAKSEREQLVQELLDEMLGLGPLEPLLKDSSISDILINGPQTVYIERSGKLEKAETRFRDLNHLIEIVQRIVGRVGRRIDESNPIVDARLADGSRLNAVIHPLAIDGALVSIRRFGRAPLTVQQLLEKGCLDEQMLGFLAACVRAGLNILISGGTGAGKTTLLNALSVFIRPDERIVTIEDAAELSLQQPHVAKMETRPRGIDGKGEITCRDLLRNALRMRPDRIIIGECRDREAFDMLQAMNTGHDGSLTTIHANDSHEALNRLAMIAAMGAPDLPLLSIQRQVAAAVHIVVQVSRLACGQRRVVQVTEVLGVSDQQFQSQDLFLWQQDGLGEKSAAAGKFLWSGMRPRCNDQIERHGFGFPIEKSLRMALAADESIQLSTEFHVAGA